MCEFCKEHGEGKKWYLQMKNYADILLREELSHPQKKMVDAKSRIEWINRFFIEFVMPAITGSSESSEKSDEPVPPKVQLSEEEILKKRKAIHFGQVLPIEDVEEVIDMVDSITRMPCGCRFITTGKTDKRYCFGFGMDRMHILDKFPDASSSLEVLDKKEAKKIFHEYDNEGLIHSIWTSVTPYVIGLCNCDRDCGAYKLYIEQNGSPRFFRAEYVCQADWDLCTGCKSCMSQCQFGAIFYSSALAKVYIDPKRCFGCGVCRAACANDSIKLLPRQKHPEAANLW